MLIARELSVKGRHADLLPATSLTAGAGEVLLVRGEDQQARTALALALTGRMRPSLGTAVWGRDMQIKRLRRRSALLDASGVNEQEQHLRVRDLVVEDLALMPRNFPFRTHSADWMDRHGFAAVSHQWIEELEPAKRLELLAELALANTEVAVMVFDSPDRHGSSADTWLPLLCELAARERPLCVVATVAQFPAGWLGRTAMIGHAPPRAAPADSTGAMTTVTTEDADDAAVAPGPEPTPTPAPTPNGSEAPAGPTAVSTQHIEDPENPEEVKPQ